MGEDEPRGGRHRLRLKGRDGAAGGDACVFPLVPSSNIHPAALMIGERAAAFLRERAG